jgi:hypothetical protein
MTITSYSALVDAITDRMNDSSLSTYAPEFIQMAEAMFNRRLFNKDAEGSATIAADDTIPLPSDYAALRSLHLDDYGPLTQLSPDDFQARWADDTEAQPENYAIMGGVIHLGPRPDSAYTVTMTYVRKLTGLSEGDTTNWLLEAHPDLYLYGSLIHAEFRGWNDGRLPVLNSAVEGMISEINMADHRARRGDLQGTVAATYF